MNVHDIHCLFQERRTKYASTLCEQNSEFSSIKAGGSGRVNNAESRHSQSTTLLSNQWNVPSWYSVVKNRPWTRYCCIHNPPHSTIQLSITWLRPGFNSRQRPFTSGSYVQTTQTHIQPTIQRHLKLPKGNTGRNVKMTSHLHLLPRFIMPNVWFLLALSTVTSPPLNTDSNKLVPDETDRNVRSLTPFYIKTKPQ
jgi:hypothetical protein